MNQIVGTEDIKHKLEYFYETFIDLITISGNKFEDDLIELTTYFFLFKTGDKFPLLIEETAKMFTNTWMHEKLKAIYEKTKIIKPLWMSVGALYARFTFYQMQTDEKTKTTKRDEGLKIMKSILGINHMLRMTYQLPEFVNSQFLTQYGDFLMHQAEKESDYDKIISLADEAITAYKIAKNELRGNPLKPYVKKKPIRILKVTIQHTLENAEHVKFFYSFTLN